MIKLGTDVYYGGFRTPCFLSLLSYVFKLPRGVIFLHMINMHKLGDGLIMLHPSMWLSWVQGTDGYYVGFWTYFCFWVYLCIFYKLPRGVNLLHVINMHKVSCILHIFKFGTDVLCSEQSKLHRFSWTILEQSSQLKYIHTNNCSIVF
jgi:hypothetical protein